MGRHNADPATVPQYPPPAWWQAAALLAIVAAIAGAFVWGGLGLLSDPNRCGGFEMSSGDRCVVRAKTADRFVPAESVVSSKGHKIGISAAEQAHQRRTYGIVTLIPAVAFAGLFVFLVVMIVRRWRMSRL